MDYKEALDYIHGTMKFGVKLGLQNIEKLLGFMGNPHKKLKYVHVGGTNGKGSTVAFISSILMESGYRVGIYTSPYLQRFTERIRINDKEIPQSELAQITCFVKENVKKHIEAGGAHPTEFEIVTAIAFQYFFENECDIVVLEVGLGGRFDSTNIIDSPLVSVITTISYDHMNILGDSLEKIAFEKAGIIKNNGDVVLYPQDEEVEKVFLNVCGERNAVLHKVSFDSIRIEDAGIDGQTFSWMDHKGLKISLLGDHQVKNSIVALKTVEILKEKGFGNIDYNSLRSGIRKAIWPGRFEILKKRPVFLIDGAHNQEGALELANNLRKYFPHKRKIFIIGVLRDKDYESIIKPIIPLADKFITVTPNSDRALPARDLAMFLRHYYKDVIVSDTISWAVEKGLSKASDDDLICACGSLYYIGEVRSLLGL